MLRLTFFETTFRPNSYAKIFFPLLCSLIRGYSGLAHTIAPRMTFPISSESQKTAPNDHENEVSKKELSESRGDERYAPTKALPDQAARRTSKRERESGEEIPFEGPTDRTFWTRGVPPASEFLLRTLDQDEAQKKLPAGRTWVFYDMGEQMGLRSAGNMTIPQWASMGYWSKNQFGLLVALSARVRDFSVVSFWSDATSEMALVVQEEDRVFVEVAHGPSKTKAKQAVAEKMIRAGDVWNWINTKYHDTPADSHLQAPAPKAAPSQPARTLLAEPVIYF